MRESLDAALTSSDRVFNYAKGPMCAPLLLCDIASNMNYSMVTSLYKLNVLPRRIKLVGSQYLLKSKSKFVTAFFF